MSRLVPPDPRPQLAGARAAVARSCGDEAAREQDGAPSAELAALVADVLVATDEAGRRRAVWLLLVALTGAMPTLHEVEDACLSLSTAGEADLVTSAIEGAVAPDRERLSRCLSGTLVDVTITATTSNHAGVPRVVRQLVAAWGERPDLHYVVWDRGALRTLDDAERTRLALAPEAAPPPGTWVVPYDATFVVVEVLRPEAHASAVEAMAFAGAADVRGMVYDLASLVETHPDAARGPFLHHLSALSRGSRVTAISQAVAADVSDYFSILARNGRPSPTVASHVLPDDPGWRGEVDQAALAALDAQLRGDTTWPLVTVVSSLHRRKNHGRLLAACEQLWDDGLEFRLLAVEGTRSRIHSLEAAVDRLVEKGRPLTLLSQVSEPMLRAAYTRARVSAYVSLAEGYGLPIVESLAAGTPVVASGHGSMAELGALGGVLMVDPRDTDAIADALRRALTEPALQHDLVTAIAGRRQSTWLDYAEAVGAFLGVVPDRPRAAVASDSPYDLQHDWERSGRTG